MGGEISFLFRDIYFDVVKCECTCKMAVQNVDCVFIYFCDGGKDNFPNYMLQLCSSLNILNKTPI